MSRAKTQSVVSDHDAQRGSRRRRDLARGAVVVEPRHLGEEPDEKELRRKRRHGEVEALDTE